MKGDCNEEDFYFSFLFCFYVDRCRGGCFSGTSFCPLAGESGCGVVFFPHRACDTAFRSVEFALEGVHIDKAHGINGTTPEETMRNMGLIASPGMVATEKTIVEIFEDKLR